MLNIRELAKLCGCSRSAVSLALRGRPGVSEATRQHVTKVAEQHGYRPNPLVTALMSQVGTSRRRKRVNSILALLSTMDMKNYPLHHNPSIIREGIIRSADRAGYLVEEFSHKHFNKDVPLARMLHVRRVQGIILYEMQDELISLPIDKSKFAFVSIGIPRPDRLIDFVSNEHAFSAKLAIQNLFRLGYRRIGLALDGGRSSYAEAGIIATMLEWQYLTGEKAIPPLIGKKWSREILLAWYRRERPDAIICSDHLALDWLREAGLKVPEDVAFAHLDVDARWKGIAGINQCNEELGVSAIDMLISSLNGNRFGLPKHPRTIKIQGMWVDGATAPPKQK